MRKAIDWFVLAALAALAVYLALTHRDAVLRIEEMMRLRSPCASPLSYSITAIDPRFKVATSTLAADLQEAEGIWETAGGGRDLFEYEPAGGAVSVRLIYDERQAATDRLSSLGIAIDESRANYEALQTRYDTLKARIDTERSSYEAAVGAYQRDESAYNAEVSRWNSAGGAPQADYDRLNAQKAALADEFAAVKSKEKAMNSDIDTLNALATTINQLIVRLNLNVEQYNGAGAESGEFEEGLYEEQDGVQTISIYEFSNRVQLVRVLAHEMGHALGLEHVGGEESIMYKVNMGTDLKASSEDRAELDSVCRFK